MFCLKNILSFVWIVILDIWIMDAGAAENGTKEAHRSYVFTTSTTHNNLNINSIPVNSHTSIPTTPPHPVWLRKKHGRHKNQIGNSQKADKMDNVDVDVAIEEDEADEISTGCIKPEDVVNEDELPVEQKLMRRLMKSYEKSVRPVKNASDTVVVRMGITLTQIFQMDEKNQILVTNVWLDQEWDDVFLQWDPAEYGGLEVLRLPCHKIWLPDIVLYNNAAEYTDGLMPANAMISYTGNVFWPVPTKLQSSCKVDVTYFPFDEQFCRLKFGSWTYDGFQVDMVNRTMDVDLSNYVPNGEWQLVSIKIYRNVVYYGCCPEPFPDVTFIIHIQRRMIYYLYNVIFPCIMMSALTLLVFCLPPDSGEKVTMGITVLLAFSVFLLRMGEDLPETSEYIPLLSIYLTVVMALTSISVIMTVMVLNLHFRGPNDAPVPGWLRYLFLGRGKIKGFVLKNHESKFLDKYISDSSFRYKHSDSLRQTIENLAQELKDDLEQGTASGYSTPHNHTNSNNERSSSVKGKDDFITEADDGSTQTQHGCYYFPQPDFTAAQHFAYQGMKSNADILSSMKKIIDRFEKEDEEEDILFQWRQVATGVDRILFCIFLFATASATIVILIVAPITRFI